MDEEDRSRLFAVGRSSRRRGVREAVAWIALIGVGLLWATAVLGISIALVDKEVAAWWVVLIFGTLPLIGLYRIAERLAHPSAGASREQTAAVTDSSGPEAALSEPSAEGSPAVSAESTADDVQTRARVDPAVVEDLTSREREVLALLDRGRTNGEIAHELFVSTATVKSHVNSIFRKLGARNRTEAVARARRLNLIS